MLTPIYQSKKEALQAARQLRALGHEVRVFCRKGVATVPFRGIESFCVYYLKVA